MTSMPTEYRPSLSTGIYGSYVLTLDNDDEKKVEIVSGTGKAGGMDMVEFITKHSLPRPNFASMSVPPSITNKSKEAQMISFASVYKNALFKNQPKQPHLGE